ncbi:phage tail tube protein [Aquabacterium sp.]|uniref:phage tail tube protein n=1 Tax=Aquabacterium sp. TaxID=1872578 RepID=UPI003D6D86CA
MTIATGVSTKVGFSVEDLYGVVNTDVELQEVTFTEFDLDLTRDELADSAIREDRMERYSLSGNRSIAGSITMQLSHALAIPFFESALQSVSVSKVLKTGVTRKSFTIEEQTTSLGQFRVFTGVVVDKFTISVAQNGIVTVKFDLIGKAVTDYTNTSIAADPYTPEALVTPYQGQNVGGFMKEGGTTVGFITAFSLDGSNGHTKNYAIGADTVRDLTTSNLDASGSITVFFEDVLMYNKFINGTISSIAVQLKQGANTTQFNCPAIKYTGAKKTISGSGAITMTMPFKALFDATAGSHIVITES